MTTSMRRVRKNSEWGYCPTTGKIRYGELRDAKQAIEHAFHSRAAARLDGREPTNRVVRAYRCPDCRGYHTTSVPFAAWSARGWERTAV